MKIFEVVFKATLLILILAFLIVFYQYSQVGRYSCIAHGSDVYVVLDTANGEAFKKEYKFIIE